MHYQSLWTVVATFKQTDKKKKKKEIRNFNLQPAASTLSETELLVPLVRLVTQSFPWASKINRLITQNFAGRGTKKKKKCRMLFF